MAGKTAIKPKVKKEEPEVSMTYIDDILLRIVKTEEDVEEIIETIDGMGLSELAARVGKVEARLGIG
jgi:nitrogen regulatory protein PII